MATYVLIHGAYQGGWIWRDVAARLRREGEQVFAPSLDGCAERHHAIRPGINTETHAAEMAGLLFYEDLHEVVLVGTSTGGMVACRTAELARDRIARIVFADALALQDGESVSDIVTRRNVVTTDLVTGPSAEDAESRLFADLAPAMRAWALARYTPHPVACLTAPVKLDRFWQQSWSATVIRCRRAANPPAAHHRRTAELLGAAYAELDTGHYPMLSTPDELASLMRRS